MSPHDEVINIDIAQYDDVVFPDSRISLYKSDRCSTAVLTSNGVFRKVSDTQFIIIVDNDTMVYIINPKYWCCCTQNTDAVVHQIAEIYFGIHSIPKILLWYIITKYPNMLPRYLKENQPPLITSWHFFIYLFLNFSWACYLFSDACIYKYHKTT